jgi:hypothetical protein
VPEAPKIPFIRITRPYGSEAEFIDGDYGWVGRTTLVLPGGPARAAGELVRFEVVLTNGAPVLRGEGHVVAHHVPGGARPAGLEVRYTRVDSRSKILLDRVRERRAAMSQGGPASLSMPAMSVPAMSLPAMPLPVMPSATSSLGPTPNGLPVLEPPTDAPSERSGVHLKTAPSRIAPPANRDEILERLRVRAKVLAAAGGLSFKRR